MHDIPAKSRLVPAIPVTSPQFVYRRARETDVGLTFARARTGLETVPGRRRVILGPRRVGHDEGEVSVAAMGAGTKSGRIRG